MHAVLRKAITPAIRHLWLTLWHLKLRVVVVVVVVVVVGIVRTALKRCTRTEIRWNYQVLCISVIIVIVVVVI